MTLTNWATTLSAFLVIASNLMKSLSTNTTCKSHLLVILTKSYAEYFDVIKEKNMYGKVTLGLVRSAFVFNKDSELTHAQRNLRAKDYTSRLLAI